MTRTTNRTLLAALCALAFLAPPPAHAIIGIGVHYGLDFSMDMDDVEHQQLVYDGLRLSTTLINNPPAGLPAEISDLQLPVYLGRTGFTRTYFDLGGKVLIDALRWFDIEVSTNIGLWEYLAEISYPTGIQGKAGATYSAGASPESLFDISYSKLPITCKALGVDYWFFDGTPYVKLHFDATIRKSFPERFKTLKLYAGGGVSLHLATPIVSAELIEEVLGEKLQASLDSVGALGADLLGNPDVMVAVLEKVVDGLAVPKFGLNIVVGTQIKVPVIPLAFYVDGKLMIPFGQMDEHVDLNGFGFLVNGGVMLKF